ncbi:hypothetical protein GCM10010309_32980 [Streptomyces violaceochromogenes]|nr:hypothetical protein GCM10010309_32980 [Streptomyces violaceochromogenes]
MGPRPGGAGCLPQALRAGGTPGAHPCRPLGAGQVLPARPAIEDEAVQAEAGARGAEPLGDSGRDAGSLDNPGNLTPRPNLTE